MNFLVDVLPRDVLFTCLIQRFFHIHERLVLARICKQINNLLFEKDREYVYVVEIIRYNQYDGWVTNSPSLDCLVCAYVVSSTERKDNFRKCIKDCAYAGRIDLLRLILPVTSQASEILIGMRCAFDAGNFEYGWISWKFVNETNSINKCDPWLLSSVKSVLTWCYDHREGDDDALQMFFNYSCPEMRSYISTSILPYNSELVITYLTCTYPDCTYKSVLLDYVEYGRTNYYVESPISKFADAIEMNCSKYPCQFTYDRIEDIWNTTTDNFEYNYRIRIYYTDKSNRPPKQRRKRQRQKKNE